MEVRGVTGDLRWGYLPAAVFGPWRLSTTPDGGTLDGAVASVDAFRLTQQPLVAVLPIGRSVYRYPVLSVDVSGPTLTASLGPRER